MYTLLVPRERSRREKKTGGGPFWKTYWEKEVEKNPKYYSNQYASRVSTLNSKVSQIKNTFTKRDRRYYAEVKLDERSSSKSSEPTQLWIEAGLEVVESKERNGETFFTLSGTPDDFEKLKQIAESATFDNAYTGKGKTQDMSRQVFAVTEIFDKNSTIENRVSAELNVLIKSNFSKPLDCILTIHFERKLSEYDAIFKEIAVKIGQDNIHKRDKEFFISNMSYRATISIKQILELLTDSTYGYIARIKLNPEFVVQRSTPNISLNSVKIGGLLTDEKVVVIDSGVDNTILNPFVAHSMNYLSTTDIPDKKHGTNVVSRLLFGHNFFEKVSNGEELQPAAKIIDVQVLHKKSDGSTGVDTDVLMKSIKEATNRVDDATIFNLSIAAKEPINEKNDIDDSTALIDSISSKKDLLFVTAVGNQNGNYPLGYEGIFNVTDGFCNVSAPSDAINSLSVGSIAQQVDPDSICIDTDHPSPFTRRGGFRNDIKKPELVAYGGNVQKDPTDKYEDAHLIASRNKYGVDVMDNSGFSRDTGTSLSAPVISRMAVMILDYLKKSNLSSQLPLFNSNKANLVKALLIHSTSRGKQAIISNEMVKRAYGFGKADYTAALFEDTEDTVTVSYVDAISFAEKKHKIMLKLPEYLLGKDLEFTYTLVYNPPVNTNFKEYKMINLQGSLGFVVPHLEDGKPNGKMDVKPLAPSHSWDNYRCTDFPTVHFKRNVKKLKYLDLQIGIQMTVSNHLLGEMAEADILQNYAIVLSIKDKSQQGKLRSQLLVSNQLVELVENTIKIKA